jgi:hypothetical protein
MNEEAKQALLLKYKDFLDGSNNDYDNYPHDDFIGEWILRGENSEDILIRFLTKMHYEFSPASRPYVKFILYFEDNNWYTYNSNNPYPIQDNLSTIINNYELFKLVKRRLIADEKSRMQRFVGHIVNKSQENQTEEDSNKFIVKYIKLYNSSMRILKDLKMDSDVYQSLKILMEQTFKKELSNLEYF